MKRVVDVFVKPAAVEAEGFANKLLIRTCASVQPFPSRKAAQAFRVILRKVFSSYTLYAVTVIVGSFEWFVLHSSNPFVTESSGNGLAEFKVVRLNGLPLY